jgi:hypothetical protein
MKEVTFRIPEDATELVTELVEKLGGEVQQPKAKKRTVIKKSKSEKPDPLAFFGKYPDFPLDPETYREQLWGRKKSL